MELRKAISDLEHEIFSDFLKKHGHERGYAIMSLLVQMANENIFEIIEREIKNAVDKT